MYIVFSACASESACVCMYIHTYTTHIYVYIDTYTRKTIISYMYMLYQMLAFHPYYIHICGPRKERQLLCRSRSHRPFGRTDHMGFVLMDLILWYCGI